MNATQTLVPTLDLDLARRADRKLRRFGSDLNRMLSFIVNFRGIPDILANVEEPRPMAADDPRLDAALATATVRRSEAGTFIAAIPDMDAEGKTKAAALANLREELRYVISDPVKVKYFAYGKSFVAEVRPGRDGGFWAVVPSLGGASTCGDTMDDLKYMLIDMTKLMIENT